MSERVRAGPPPGRPASGSRCFLLAERAVAAARPDERSRPFWQRPADVSQIPSTGSVLEAQPSHPRTAWAAFHFEGAAAVHSHRCHRRARDESTKKGDVAVSSRAMQSLSAQSGAACSKLRVATVVTLVSGGGTDPDRSGPRGGGALGLPDEGRGRRSLDHLWLKTRLSTSLQVNTRSLGRGPQSLTKTSETAGLSATPEVASAAPMSTWSSAPGAQYLGLS